MGLKRVSTLHGELVVNDGRGEVKLSATEVRDRKGREDKVQGELEAKAGRSLGVPVFYHKNRDGSIAVATGTPPMTNGVVVWTEDQPSARYERGQIP